MQTEMLNVLVSHPYVFRRALHDPWASGLCSIVFCCYYCFVVVGVVVDIIVVVF